MVAPLTSGTAGHRRRNGNQHDWPEFSKKLWRTSGSAVRLEAGFRQSAKKPEIGMEPGYFFFEGPLLFRAPSVVRTAE